VKIAITGGTGFVGRNIARALAADGHEVALIARGHDHTDPSIQHLQASASSNRASTIQTNWREHLQDAMPLHIAQG